MMFNPSIYRTNRRRYFGGVPITLTAELIPLLTRSRLNPGKTYRVQLSHGLTVAFRTMHDQTTIQLSRPKPVEPSQLELVTCLKAINVSNPETIPTRKLQDANNHYLQADLIDQGS
jgi:hypothetical protein